MKIKHFLKQFAPAIKINAFAKRLVLRRNIASIEQHYKNRESSLFIDSECAPFVSTNKELVVPSTLFIGTMEAQDRSGMLQAIEEVSEEFTYFTKIDGSYGLEFPDDLDDLAPMRRNSERIQALWEANGRPKLIIGQMMGLNVDSACLRHIRECGTTIINISMDDRLPELWISRRDGRRRGAIELAREVNITFTTCSNTVPWYQSEGATAQFTTLACGIGAKFVDLEKDIPVSFVGNCYGERERIIASLRKAKIPIEAYGKGWENGPVDAETAREITKRSKVVLGSGLVGHSRNIYTLKLRDFDALASGGCYITHRNPDLLLLFNEGEHLLCYESAEELIQKIRMCLANESYASKIGLAGMSRVLNRYTWDSVVNNILFQQAGN